MTTADLDGDGDLDAVVSIWDQDSVVWYPNDGMGNFGAARLITTTAVGAYHLHVVDLNGDGYLDVLCASYSDDRITWYENTDGLGNFFAHDDIADDAVGAIYVFGADLNGDGATDVVSASNEDGRITMYTNEDGLGTFATGIDIAILEGAVSVVAADLDDDGDMDLLCTGLTSGYIIWYENTDGLGTFDTGTVLLIDIGAREAIAADLDGDGDLDIVAASYDGERIMWFENFLYSPTSGSTASTGNTFVDTNVPTLAPISPGGSSISVSPSPTGSIFPDTKVPTLDPTPGDRSISGTTSSPGVTFADTKIPTLAPSPGYDTPPATPIPSSAHTDGPVTPAPTLAGAIMHVLGSGMECSGCAAPSPIPAYHHVECMRCSTSQATITLPAILFEHDRRHV